MATPNIHHGLYQVVFGILRSGVNAVIIVDTLQCGLT